MPDMIDGEERPDQLATSAAMPTDRGTQAIRHATDDLLGEFTREQRTVEFQPVPIQSQPTVALAEPVTPETGMIGELEMPAPPAESSPLSYDDFAGATINLQN